MPRFAVLAWMRVARQVIGDAAQVAIQNYGAVQLDFNRRAFDRDFLVIPFTNRMLVAALGCHYAISRAVGLPQIDLFPGRLFVIVIEHLAFAHALVRSVPVTWITNREAVVAPGWQLYLEPRDEISIFLFCVNRAALSRPASDGAVLHLIIVQRPGPAFEIFAIEDGFKTRRVSVSEQFIRLFRTDLAKEKIAPANFAAVGLELKRSFGGHRQLPIIVIF